MFYLTDCLGSVPVLNIVGVFLTNVYAKVNAVGVYTLWKLIYLFKRLSKFVLWAQIYIHLIYTSASHILSFLFNICQGGLGHKWA